MKAHILRKMVLQKGNSVLLVSRFNSKYMGKYRETDKGKLNINEFKGLSHVIHTELLLVA